MTAPVVLIIEDEAQVRLFLRTALSAAGYRVVEAERGAEAATLARSHNPALVLLDLGLPDADGITVTRALREWSTSPILVISARGREEDKIQALDAGADDYLTKPFGTGELLARIRSALRRSVLSGSANTTVVEVEGVRIDMERRVVTRDGIEVHLKPTEYNLLALLAKNAGKVMTYGQILKEVWGPGAVTHTHYVRVQMAELRKKLECDPAQPAFLITEAGVGYRLRA
ncbi:MAG: response regulator [Deltaproteobacteria bacterium]|nr:response regulator [Deltaproteobacteria bacterium]